LEIPGDWTGRAQQRIQDSRHWWRLKQSLDSRNGILAESFPNSSSEFVCIARRAMLPSASMQFCLLARLQVKRDRTMKKIVVLAVMVCMAITVPLFGDTIAFTAPSSGITYPW
jgi:hypothetical protein